MPLNQSLQTCPICQRHGHFKFIQDARNQNGQFSLYECSLCGVQFWTPFRSPGADWYEQGDCYNIKDSSKPRILHSYHKIFLNSHKNLGNSTKVLDLGCGTGEFLAALQKNKIEVWGTDIDKEAINIARESFDLKNVYPLPVEEFIKTIPLPLFDFITMFEVLEHIDSPWFILTEAKKLLKPDGRLIISMPSKERIFVNLSSWDFPFHHLSRWSEKSMKNILDLAGYKNVRIIYFNQIHFLYDLFLEIISKKLKFKKSANLKQLSQKNNQSLNTKKSLRRLILGTIYKTGRFLGVIILPYFLAYLVAPISFIFFPRGGAMYIECLKK